MTLAISPDTDYAKLMWNASNIPDPLPAGLTFGTLGGVSALVTFTAQQADSPYFMLAFTDPSQSFGQASPTDQILLIEFQSLGISGVGQTTMTIDPNATLFNVYDNTTGTYLLGGQSHTNTLNGYLAAYPVLASEPIGGVWLAIGLSGGCSSPGSCHESLAVDSASLTLLTFSSDAPVQMRYAANPVAGESYIDIANTGYNGEEALGPSAGNLGNICVNVYALDATDEQEVACCSCLVTPNAVVDLGVNADLTSRTLTGVIPPSVSIKLVATLAGAGGTGTSCSGSAAAVTSTNIVRGMIAWGTTLHPMAGAGVYTTTETQFTPVAASAADIASLAGRCASILSNGSTYGVCTSCGAGALGASKR
ncbi:MAG: hypothetical protein ACLQVN_03250 [Bryobacteraceae bacterium]